MARSRDDTLAILRGRRINRLPVFSGLPSLTASGLKQAGVCYSDAHTDAKKMAVAAASTFEVYGFESAVVPFDLCVEAETLGAHVDFQSDVDSFLAPVVDQSLTDISAIVHRHSPFAIQNGRVPLVTEAIRLLKAGVGREIAIGAWVTGPFTLAWQMFGAEAWLSSLTETMQTAALLSALADFLARVANVYCEAGADFITVHEMGGSPQIVGPQNFRALVKPALVRLFAQLPAPNVLSMCGDTNAIIADMAVCGANALHVDQCNDLARTRRLLGDDVIVLGNFDPMQTLSAGTLDAIADAVRAIARAGANAIWPGCDLWPEIPDENMRALMDAAQFPSPSGGG
jgi:MtaA/CmuA family methyltransferase